ncbi:AAA family ATPase [Rhizobium leguminosarum]|uniref:AAA family ATPase n=1 Tax=Rhizobium leguminosarum TaxID=384 RepID=UPI0010320735|nr:AAA family ATPase [Rhizobium leguminosarum]TBH59778.1 AAA family ATPase [Rhizobium leguminosarum]
MANSGDYLVEFRTKGSPQRLRDAVKKAPGLFLLNASFRRALRSQHRLRNGLTFMVVVITGTEEITQAHRKAAELALSGGIEFWPHPRRESRAYIHVLDPPSRKKIRTPAPVVEWQGQHDFVLVLARNRSNVPDDLKIIADDVVDLAGPTTRHIKAVRRLLGREPVDDVTAAAIASLNFSALVSAVCRPRVSLEIVQRLAAASRPVAIDPVPRLEDLPGYGSAREWALTFVEDVDRCKRGEMDWSHMDRGVLLYGPPGTGKTLLAQAIARSAGLPLIVASVSGWQSYGHLGNLLEAMRRTFEMAQAQQPAIVFLDEIDAIGDRTRFADNHANYSRQVVNYLLESIDGAGGRQQVIVIGATNYPEAIDAALLRSGRLERHIPIMLPDKDERFEILRFHLCLKEGLEELREIAADLEGWTGADLEMLTREATRIGRRQNRPAELDDVAKSLPPVQELSEESARRIAVHEAGHVVVAHVLSPRSRISVSMRRQFRWIGSESRQRGGTAKYEAPDDDRAVDTRQHLESFICRALAGAAAEEHFLGCRSNGFSGSKGSDLDEATVVATQMVVSYGMSKSLAFLTESRHVTAESTRRLPNSLREEVDRILEEQYSRALSIVAEHAISLDRLATALLEKGTLTADDVDDLIAGHQIAGRNASVVDVLAGDFGRCRGDRIPKG